MLHPPKRIYGHPPACAAWGGVDTTSVRRPAAAASSRFCLWRRVAGLRLQRVPPSTGLADWRATGLRLRKSFPPASFALTRRRAASSEGPSPYRSRLLACDRVAYSEDVIFRRLRSYGRVASSEGPSPCRSRYWRATGSCLRKHHCGVFDADGDPRAFLAPAIGDLL